MFHDHTVFVVDDDLAARASVCALAESMGVEVEAFPSAEQFLGSDRVHRSGCLVSDVRMVGMNGLELQQTLARRGICLPVILITAHAETSLTVQAMKNGAVTLLEKPYGNHELWEAISKGLSLAEESRQRRARHHVLRQQIESLTPNERRVMDSIVEGTSNKAIAVALSVSLRTVEARRHRVFKKTQCESVAQLVRLVLEFQSLSASLADRAPDLVSPEVETTFFDRTGNRARPSSG